MVPSWPTFGGLTTPVMKTLVPSGLTAIEAEKLCQWVPERWRPRAHSLAPVAASKAAALKAPAGEYELAEAVRNTSAPSGLAAIWSVSSAVGRRNAGTVACHTAAPVAALYAQTAAM